MTGARLITTQTLSDEQVILESARDLILAHDYRAALATLANASVHGEQVTLWTLIARVGAGDLELAIAGCTTALARGWRTVLGALAAAQRLRGEPRAYLQSITATECAALGWFERTMLEREIGLWYLETECFQIALVWLERAWRTAMTGPYGDEQLAGIATPLAAALARLGFDARAVMVLDEGIRRCDRTRRVPLLYERALRNLHLGRLEATNNDLAELETHVPRGDAELPLLVAYARARYTHALGVVGDARGLFNAVHEAAALSGVARPAVRELALHSALWLAALHLEADDLDTARGWLHTAEGYASGVRDRAWLTLRRAQACALAGGYAEAADGFAGAARDFSNLEARVESAVAHVHRAEALLRMGFEHEDEAGDALLAAAALTAEIGGAAPVRLELRTLTRVRAFLEQPYARAKVQALLEPGHAYRAVRVLEDRLEAGEERLAVSVSGARLVAYLRAHPCSTWMHVRDAVYAHASANAARVAFERDRALVASVPGLEVVYMPATHAYSLVWSGVTLEVARAETHAWTAAAVG